MKRVATVLAAIGLLAGQSPRQCWPKARSPHRRTPTASPDRPAFQAGGRHRRKERAHPDVARFQSSYPKVKVSVPALPGAHPAGMAGNFAAGDVPDVFYVDTGYADPGSTRDYLAPLDDYITKTGHRHEPLLPAARRSSTEPTARPTACPRTATPSEWPTTQTLVTKPPKTMDELVTAATALKGTGKLQAPLCLNPGLDRGLAFLYAQGGSTAVR